MNYENSLTYQYKQKNRELTRDNRVLRMTTIAFGGATLALTGWFAYSQWLIGTLVAALR